MMVITWNDNYIYTSEDSNTIKVYDKKTMSLIEEVPVLNSRVVI